MFSPPSDDDAARENVGKLLSDWVASFKPTIIVCPMTVGRHIDHVVTTDAARREAPKWDASIYLYEDIPYSAGFFPPDYPDSVPAARERATWKSTDFVDVDVDFDRKFAAIKLYESQIAEIFPGLDAEAELRKYMGAEQNGTFRERFWRVANDGGNAE